MSDSSLKDVFSDLREKFGNKIANSTIAIPSSSEAPNKIPLPTFKLGAQQEAVIEDFLKWYNCYNPNDPNTLTYKLAGYAGTGKTSIVPFLQHVTNDYLWVFGTLTGKASGVLRSKGINSSTIHSQLYRYTENPGEAEKGLLLHIKALKELREETYDREILYIITKSIESREDMLSDLRSVRPKRRSWYTLNPESSFFGASIICIDEGSMIDKIMEIDIMLARKRTLYIGDNEQLPPISKYSSVFFDRYGKVLPVNYQLTDIRRQAKENPIIALSMDIREGRSVRYGSYGSAVRVVPFEKITDGLIDKVEINICGTNQFRQELNELVRNVRGYNTPYPLAGEDIIFRVNNHSKGVFNGMTAKADTDAEAIGNDLFLMDVTCEDEMTLPGEQFSGLFMRGQLDKNNIPSAHFKSRLFAEYGYGITCHSSQGSTYRNGILFGNTCVSQNAVDRRRWWYTGVTRFAEKLIIVR